MNPSLEVSRKIALAYNSICKPFCKELGLPQTAFDILMFLGNNPTYKTACEIAEIRCIKANLVSVNVDRLVRDGYLLRRPAEGDRRKTELLCTEKAQPIIQRGRQFQKMFFERLFFDMPPDTRREFAAGMHIIEKNLNEILEESTKQ